MATFLESYETAKDPAFKKRVVSAMYKVAQAVADEATAANGQAQAVYEKRQTLAYKLKYQAEALVELWALAVCAGGIVTGDSLDDAIEFTIVEKFNAFAGVTKLDV
jgi:hypothetical protein